MNISPGRLDRLFHLHQAQYEEAALRVLRSGHYVLGNEVLSFEREFAKYIGTKHCVGLASGLDALEIAFKLLDVGEGDEVIVQSNAYIACVMGITINKAVPVFVEPDEHYNIDATKIEAVITPNTKAILVVHLYGQSSDMAAIMGIADKYKLYVVEDCAQSHGAGQGGVMTGAFGDIGCFSFYPSKNIGAFGDGGAVVVNCDKLNEDFRVYRNYGSEKRYYNKIVGTNSRLDEMQAALLRVKLEHLDEANKERARLCAVYLEKIKNPLITLPSVRVGCDAVWHQFVVRAKNRNFFVEYLNSKGIGTIIHYPIPPHLSDAYAYLGYKEGSFPVAEEYANTVVSLPLYIGMTQQEQEYVIDAINGYKEK